MYLDKKPKKRQEAQPLAAVDASSASSSVASSPTIIDENAQKVKASKTSSAKTVKNKSGLVMSSTVPDLNIKIYEEQLPDGLEEFKKRVPTIPKDDFAVLAIVHDRDLVADEIFVESLKKPHIHIMILKQGVDANNRKQRRKVSTFLNVLGIEFREGLDEMIWAERGVERIKDVGESVAYLTHETPQAQKDGKEIYERSEIITNLDNDEVQQLREGYERIVGATRRVNIKDQAELADKARLFGYTGSVSWEQFEADLPFVLQKGSTYNLLRKRYSEGVDQRMEERTDILRLCVFIQGEANQGKTYAAKHAFDGQGLRVLKVGDGGKTGKFDRLSEDHDVLILDDAIVHDVLGMADNNAVQVYKRGADNPYWCGSYFIITSNFSFEQWAERCGIDSHTMDAAKSRFYICQVGENSDGSKFLHVDSYSTRGTYEEQVVRRDRFIEFRKKFENIINQYRPDGRVVDYSMI